MRQTQSCAFHSLAYCAYLQTPCTNHKILFAFHLHPAHILCAVHFPPSANAMQQATSTKHKAPEFRFLFKRQAPSLNQVTLCAEHQAVLLFTRLHASIPFVPRSFCIGVLEQLLINTPLFFHAPRCCCLSVTRCFESGGCTLPPKRGGSTCAPVAEGGGGPRSPSLPNFRTAFTHTHFPY